GRVTGVDWDRRQLLLDGEAALAFDYLVVAAGAVDHYFDLGGAADGAVPLYSLPDAVAVRNHVLERFEAADVCPALGAAGALTFVVVGGGPTGVEVAGALTELFAMVLRKDFRALDVTRARIVLVELADRLLPPFSPSSGAHATRILRLRGVE